MHIQLHCRMRCGLVDLLKWCEDCLVVFHVNYTLCVHFDLWRREGGMEGGRDGGREGGRRREREGEEERRREGVREVEQEGRSKKMIIVN